MKGVILSVLVCTASFSYAQVKSKISTYNYLGDVTVTIDAPAKFKKYRQVTIIIYALPNGNSTAQTMGKKMTAGDDWHYDIQHIKAQTSFIRKALPKENIVVCYFENQFKSWPLWKQKHLSYTIEIPALIDVVYRTVPGHHHNVFLNGHSGGGSFIFGYLDAVPTIPPFIKRISFIDSNYGYDSSYAGKLTSWLKSVPGAALTVFAYNDSVALYKGKKLVSATGGTWHRSHIMQTQLSEHFDLRKMRNDSIISYQSRNPAIGFFYKSNPDSAIYHTQQVELNGFIHSILFGTKKENVGYRYYGERAYGKLIE
jgi:hypothetical protein